MPPSRSNAAKPKRYHQKCRTGCVPCKKRKIKCNEERPVCSHCKRSSTKCVYIATKLSSGTHSSYQTHQNDLPLTPDSQPKGGIGHGALSTNNPPPGTGFGLVHMELLYHWCTTTSLTLTRSPELTTLWRIGVTEIGLKNEFVLSAILALTARHLSRLRPAKQSYYEDLAINLQHKALNSAKEAQVLPDVSEANCSSVFIFSVFIWMNAVATRRKPDDELHIRSAADWVMFLRGITSIAKSGKSWLWSGNVSPFIHFGTMGPMMEAKRREGGMDTPPEANRRLDHLESLISVIEDEEKRILYTKAVKKLQEAFSNYHSLAKGTCGLSVIFQWPAQLSEEYLGLLTGGEPEALVIFSYYAVLMSKLLPCWWLEGRVEWIIASVHSHLGVYHRTWIQWPMEELGWISE